MKQRKICLSIRFMQIYSRILNDDMLPISIGILGNWDLGKVV